MNRLMRLLEFLRVYSPAGLLFLLPRWFMVALAASSLVLVLVRATFNQVTRISKQLVEIQENSAKFRLGEMTSQIALALKQRELDQIRAGPPPFQFQTESALTAAHRIGPKSERPNPGNETSQLVV
jgi:hypothetical protein